MKQKTYLFHTILVIIIIGIVLVIGYLGIQNNDGILDEDGVDGVNPDSLTSSGCDVQDRVYFPVPEIGVEFFVTKGFVDQLVYRYANNEVVWSTKKLEKIEGCELSYDSEIDTRYGPMGSVSITGYNDEELQVSITGPQAPCYLTQTKDEHINDLFLAVYGPNESCIPFIRKIVQ